MNKVNVLYEDKNLIAVDKPAGLLVYWPSHLEKTEKTLLDQVFVRLNFSVKGERRGVVHRLDRETSGVILFAKNENSEKALKNMFKKRKIKKKYVALVWGRMDSKRGKIIIPLGRASKDRLKTVPKSSGKKSETSYEVIKYFSEDKMSLVDVELKTGRMHQIRAHFAAIGHPVVGDRKYSRKKSDLGRHFIHASEIEFTDPFSEKNILVKSNISHDLKLYLKTLS